MVMSVKGALQPRCCTWFYRCLDGSRGIRLLLPRRAGNGRVTFLLVSCVSRWRRYFTYCGDLRPFVTAAAPLIQAIAESAGARERALVAYQAEIEAVGLKDGLAPENLAAASGRAKAREQLGGLRAALDALVKHDALVQARLDESLSGWLANQPRWRNETWRQQLLSASVPMADTMSEFFGVEKDMVNLIEGLLGHLDTVGSGVMLEQAAQQELVFTKQEDLRFYRATLTRLGTLGRTEQLLLAQARQVSEQYARRVGGLLTTGLAPAP